MADQLLSNLAKIAYVQIKLLSLGTKSQQKMITV